jgi:hypothetical protein
VFGGGDRVDWTKTDGRMSVEARHPCQVHFNTCLARSGSLRSLQNRPYCGEAVTRFMDHGAKMRLSWGDARSAEEQRWFDAFNGFNRNGDRLNASIE